MRWITTSQDTHDAPIVASLVAQLCSRSAAHSTNWACCGSPLIASTTGDLSSCRTSTVQHQHQLDTRHATSMAKVDRVGNAIRALRRAVYSPMTNSTRKRGKRGNERSHLPKRRRHVRHGDACSHGFARAAPRPATAPCRAHPCCCCLVRDAVVFVVVVRCGCTFRAQYMFVRELARGSQRQ